MCMCVLSLRPLPTLGYVPYHHHHRLHPTSTRDLFSKTKLLTHHPLPSPQTQPYQKCNYYPGECTTLATLFNRPEYTSHLRAHYSVRTTTCPTTSAPRASPTSSTASTAAPELTTSTSVCWATGCDTIVARAASPRGEEEEAEEGPSCAADRRRRWYWCPRDFTFRGTAGARSRWRRRSRPRGQTEEGPCGKRGKRSLSGCRVR